MRAGSLALGMLVTLVVAVPAVAQEERTSRPVVATANDKVLIQRGQEFLPAIPNMTLQERDKIVVLEGGSADITCDGDKVGNYTETGIYPAPACGKKVAAAPQAAEPAKRVVVTEAAGGTNWGSVAAVAGGVLLVAIASTTSRDSQIPVSP